MKKKIICLLAIATALFSPLVARGWGWDQSGTGTSSGANAQSGKGNWNGGVVGIRVTFVNADGSRLKIVKGDKTYYSDSIDLYGSRKSNGGVTRVTNKAEHTQCKKPDGKYALCSKTDLSLGNYDGWIQGSYSWGDASDYGIEFGNFINRNGKTPNASFKKIESNPTNAKKLFKACFGLNYDDAFKSTEAASCTANKENLKKAYIIYEPVTSYGSEGKDVTVGTGSELLYKTSEAYKGSKLHCSVLSAMANAVKITKNSCNTKKYSNCNLGLKALKETNFTFGVGRENCSKDNFKKYTKSNKSGYFVGILVSPLPPSGEEPQCDATDYTVDAACVGCDDTEKDANRSSYIIQDTTDWEGILRSDETDYMCKTATKLQRTNAEKYYKTKTSCGKIYCREEVRVIFPNANDTPTVERGRYFTVHSPFRKDDNTVITTPMYSPDYNADVTILNETKYNHNWGAIKIQKIKQCRMKGKKSNGEKNCLTAKSDKLKFKKDPEIRLTYKGNAKDKTEADKEYEKVLNDLPLDVEPSGEFGSKTSHPTPTVTKSKYKSSDESLESNWIYQDVQTLTYKLPGTTFRYVDKESGNYSSTKKDGKYADLGIAAIPVSINNEVFTDKDATLSLSFKLDSDMHLSETFSKNNDYLPSCATKETKGTETNIYKYITKTGTITSTGVSGIKDAKKRSEIANSACAKLYLCSATKDGISCKKKGVNTCIKNRTVNKIGNTDSSNCYVKNTVKSNGNTNYICGVYVEPGNPETPDDVPLPECPGCNEPDPNFRDPDPNPNPKPSPTSDEGDIVEKCAFKLSNGVCVPATGYSNIVYRTVDLTQPFPGRTGRNRYTGVNWCQYNEKTGVYSCNPDDKNKVVSTYILNNRGVKGNDVYDLTPMYTVELNADTIRSIRAYNANTTYDDFNLYCDSGEDIKKGRRCTSSFVSQYATKNCSDFSTCSGG